MTKRRMVVWGSTAIIVMGLVLGLATMMGGRSEAVGDGLSLDHFLSYQIRTTAFEPIQVGLKDQFDSGVFEVTGPMVLFNPTRKSMPDENSTGVFGPEAHLKGYAIRQIDGEYRRVSNLLVSNQLGTFLVDTISARLLLVPSAKIHLEDEPDQSEATSLDHDLFNELSLNSLDHFKCYGISTSAMYDTEGILPLPVHLGLRDQFQDEKFEVGRPALLCNPAAKIHGDQVFGINHKEAHLMCFEARPMDGDPVQELARTLNQFGPEMLKTVREDQLCVPSRKLRPVSQLPPIPLDAGDAK